MNTDWGAFSLYVVSAGGSFAAVWLLNQIGKIKNREVEMK